MTPKAPQQALPQLPKDIPPPPVLGQDAVDTRTQRKSPVPYALNPAAVPSKANVGQKQLMGR